MSSFLDFTGLDRLATKLKAYFMKKPTTAVGNSSTPVYVDDNGNVQACDVDYTNHGTVANFDTLFAAIKAGPPVSHGAFIISTPYTLNGVTIRANTWYTYRWTETAGNGDYGILDIVKGTGTNTTYLERYMLLVDSGLLRTLWQIPSTAGFGTSGQYLKSMGADKAPVWDDTSNLSVGSAQTATTASDYNTSSGSINSEFNKRLYRTCSAVSHGVENTGNENYYKFASASISNQYENRNGTFLIVAVGERKENQVLAILKVNFRTFSKTDNVIASEVGAYLYVISDPNNNFKNNSFSVHYSVTNTWQAVLELWIGCNMRYGGVSVTELNSGYRQGMPTSLWTYYSGAFTTLPSGSVTITPLRLLSGLNSGVGAANRPIYVSEYGTVEVCTQVASCEAINRDFTLPALNGVSKCVYFVTNVNSTSITASYGGSAIGTVPALSMTAFQWYNGAWHKHSLA